MLNGKYAQISQDACGILKSNDSIKWSGIFTDSVESCAVYVFEGQEAVVMCHDSGQMSIDNIVEIVSKFGPIKGVKVLRHASNAFHSHEDRKYSICKRLNFSASCVEEIFSSYDTFAAVYDKNKSLRATRNENPASAEPPPDIAYRWAVAKLNNAYIEPKSTTLPGNLQFNGDCYLPALKPILTLPEIMKIVEQQPQFFFMNLSVLLLAHEEDVLVLPARLLDFSKSHGITKNEWINDVSLQTKAFAQFKAQSLHTAERQ